MPAESKKCRQRNRPRNKANRQNAEQDGNISLVEPTTATTPAAENSISSNLNKLLNPAAAAADVQKQQVMDPNEAIKIVQQLLRAKLLKKQKDDEKKKLNNSEKLEKSSKTVNNDKKKREIKTSKSPSPKSTTVFASTSANSKTSNKNSDKTAKNKSVEIKSDKAMEKKAFIENIQKKMEDVMAQGGAELPQNLFDNLQMLLNQEPISDVESDDDAEEYIEYIYTPRRYFVVSLCNLCKCDLLQKDKQMIKCSRCELTYYCSAEHQKADDAHRQLCYGLKQVADNSGNPIFYKCGDFTAEQFRSYRIVTIRKVESMINRALNATEQEAILFPRICSNIKCREHRFSRLVDCNKCGQVAWCKTNAQCHRNKPQHEKWCKSYQLFKEMVMFQEIYGRLDPSLPTKILLDFPSLCSNTKQILSKLSFDMRDACEYAALSQISTGPLTAWYSLKMCNQLKDKSSLTVHLIGAEIEFEVDTLHKWELFFLHITPTLKELNVVFVGPELNPRNISFDQLQKTKCCRICRKEGRTVNYFFENMLYHKYVETENFIRPELICFFNAGLYRSTGFQMQDTWPETILAASNLKCPVVVTSYTEYEAPLDMSRFVQECNRRLNVVLPPIVNPFASDKPERNFISDEEAPLMFKNYFCFIVE